MKSVAVAEKKLPPKMLYGWAVTRSVLLRMGKETARTMPIARNVSPHSSRFKVRKGTSRSGKIVKTQYSLGSGFAIIQMADDFWSIWHKGREVAGDFETLGAARKKAPAIIAEYLKKKG